MIGQFITDHAAACSAGAVVLAVVGVAVALALIAPDRLERLHGDDPFEVELPGECFSCATAVGFHDACEGSWCTCCGTEADL